MSGNPLKGEVAFEVSGATYTLVYSINSLCTLEDRLDLTVQQIGERMSTAMRLSFLRQVFHGGLTSHHPQVTEEQAGELIQDLGVPRAGELIADAFFKAFADGKESAAPRPRKAKTGAGTGPSSSLSGAS